VLKRNRLVSNGASAADRVDMISHASKQHIGGATHIELTHAGVEDAVIVAHELTSGTHATPADRIGDIVHANSATR
jgi:hypothetical protein